MMAEGILNPIQQLEAEIDFDVYTKKEVDALLDEKADKSDTYTKTETDNLLSAKADADSVYTKTEIDTKIPNSVGSATKPTYVNGGIITECTYELNKTVPADAVFTDTTYSAGNGLNLTSTTFSAKAGTNVTVDASGINVVGNGSVASADSGLINGGTAYTELRPTLDGTWVKNAQTTATNLQKLEGGLEYLYGLLSKQYDQLKKYVNGNYYDYDADTDAKYVKSVPANAMPYASIDQIGGKTVVWNQLLSSVITDNWARQKGEATSISYNDGEATVEVVATGYASWQYGTRLVASKNYYVYNGHKYYISVETKSDMDLLINPGQYAGMNFDISSSSTWVRTSQIKTSTLDTTNGFFGVQPYNSYSPTVGDKYSFRKPMMIDLTLTFGAGNEPSTTAEVEAILTNDYYAYNAGSLLSAGVTDIVSKDANNTEIATYSIPAEVQALTGYGWSAGNVYNYIDFERKVYVQNVGSRAYASGDESDSTVVTDMTTTYYPLNPAIETDISAYLTDDNLIEVEAGGTLTFPNSNGDDYRIDVPSSETYMIDLSV